MKALFLGFTRSAGVSKKTGKPYDICKLFAALPLAPGSETQGTQGTEFQMEPSLMPKLHGVAVGTEIELEMQTIMRYGEQQQQIASISLGSGPRSKAA
jgi:hypothetical protein